MHYTFITQGNKQQVFIVNTLNLGIGFILSARLYCELRIVCGDGTWEKVSIVSVYVNECD
jgi:hypothetical protein